MIARRLAAVALTVALIAGAYLIRNRVIDNDGGDASPDASSPTTLICIDELTDVCRSLGSLDGLVLVIEPAATTLERLQSDDADSMVWLTMAPFPEMAAQLRGIGRRPEIETNQTVLATSPLALVVRTSDASTVAERCAAAAIDLACLGELTDLSPTFAPISSAIGTLGVASTLVAFGDGSFDALSLDLLTWAGKLKRSGATSLSGGTAVGTIQTRPTFGIAVGAEAELADARRSSFEVLYADPMVHLDVELMVPDAASPPSGLVDEITAGLLAAGWNAAVDGQDSGVPQAGVVLATRTFWEEL